MTEMESEAVRAEGGDFTPTPLSPHGMDTPLTAAESLLHSLNLATNA
jgi:hypothetical protein